MSIDGKRADKLFQDIRSLVKVSKRFVIDRAEKLYQMKELGLYRAYAETWKAFLADPDIHLSVPTDSRERRVYKIFVKDLGIKKNQLYGANIRLLAMMAHEMTKANVGSWLDKARFLSESDFEKEFKETFRGAKNPLECSHTKTKTKVICEECNERIG